MENSENSPPSPKTQLAVALADGISAGAWARKNNVARQTAYNWAKEPEVRAEVESCRRRALDRAIGRMSRRATWTAEGIATLAGEAVSESVRLAAYKALFSSTISLSNFSGLEQRIAVLEQEQRDRTANTAPMGGDPYR